MYFGAEHFIGFFTLVPSAQWYSNLVTERERERGGGERRGGRDRENDIPQICPIKVKEQSQARAERGDILCKLLIPTVHISQYLYM